MMAGIIFTSHQLSHRQCCERALIVTQLMNFLELNPALIETDHNYLSTGLRVKILQDKV
jgi:hypothetical protein